VEGVAAGAVIGNLEEDFLTCVSSQDVLEHFVIIVNLLDKIVTYTLLRESAPTVVEYIREDGANPFRASFETLHAQPAAKVAVATLRLEAGNLSSVRWIGPSVSIGSTGGRVIGSISRGTGDALIILLGGGTKQRQQVDIDRATALWAEYKARKAAAAKATGKR
jgi:putative component of toxin-antitoxin plasmid stabilization module